MKKLLIHPWSLLILLFIVFFYRQLFFGEVFYCCDNLTIIIPSRKLLIDALTHGYFPLTNPYVFSGSPFLADINLALLSPLNILYFLLPIFSALTASVIVNIFIALTGMYVLSRYLKISKEASLLSAIVFGFSGTMMVYTNNISMIGVAALVPWVVWAIDRYVSKPTQIRLAIASIIMTLQIFSGHPQFMYYTWLFTSAFVFWRERHISKLIYPGFLLLMLVFLLSAVQTIPFIEFVRESTRVGRDYAYATSGSLNPIDLVRFVLPNIVGNLSTNFVIARLGSLYGYIGVIPLLLLFYAKRSNPLALFFWLATIVSLFLTFGKYTPIYKFAYAIIPGIASFRSPENFLLIYTLSVAMLCGFGLDGWIENRLRKYVPFFVVSGIYLASAISLGFVSYDLLIDLGIHIQGLTPGVFVQWLSLIQKNLLVSGGLLALVGALQCGLQGESLQILSGRSIRKLCVVVVVFLELFIFSRHNLITIPKNTVDGWILEGKKTADSLKPFDATRENIFVDQKTVYYPGARGKPYIDIPQEMEWQFKILRPNINMLYGILTIDGYASLVDKRYAQNFQKANFDPTGIRIPTEETLLRSFGVTKLILSKNGQVTHISFSPTKSEVSKTIQYDSKGVRLGAMFSLIGLFILFAMIVSEIMKNKLSIIR